MRTVASRPSVTGTERLPRTWGFQRSSQQSPWHARTVGHPNSEMLVHMPRRPVEKEHIQGHMETHGGRTRTRPQASCPFPLAFCIRVSIDSQPIFRRQLLPATALALGDTTAPPHCPCRSCRTAPVRCGNTTGRWDQPDRCQPDAKQVKGWRAHRLGGCAGTGWPTRARRRLTRCRNEGKGSLCSQRAGETQSAGHLLCAKHLARHCVCRNSPTFMTTPGDVTFPFWG